MFETGISSQILASPYAYLIPVKAKKKKRKQRMSESFVYCSSLQSRNEHIKPRPISFQIAWSHERVRYFVATISHVTMISWYQQINIAFVLIQCSIRS